MISAPDSPQRKSPSATAPPSALGETTPENAEKPGTSSGLTRRNRTLCVGSSYQAQLPPRLSADTLATLPPREEIPVREECLWLPDGGKVEPADLDNYCMVAREQQYLEIDEVANDTFLPRI